MLDRLFGGHGGFFGAGMVDNSIILLILSIPRIVGEK